MVTPINEKKKKKKIMIDFTLLKTPKNYKPINSEKGNEIRETYAMYRYNRIDTVVKNDEGNKFNENILNNFHKTLKI